MDSDDFRQSPPTVIGRRIYPGEVSKAKPPMVPRFENKPTPKSPQSTSSLPGAGAVPKKPQTLTAPSHGPVPKVSTQTTLPGVAQHEAKLAETASKQAQGPGSQLALPGTGVSHGPAQPSAPKPAAKPPSTPTDAAKPPGGGETKPPGGEPPKKPVEKAGPNILGWYHFGQALGMAATSQTGGAQSARLLAGRAVAGVHGLLNRKTPAHFEAARAQREAQLQRQQGLRRMAGEGGGVMTRGLPVIPGTRRMGRG